jgi:hypothetical protein
MHNQTFNNNQTLQRLGYISHKLQKFLKDSPTQLAAPEACLKAFTAICLQTDNNTGNLQDMWTDRK